MSAAEPDPRLNLYRDDLAADYLRGEVEAARFVTGETVQLIASQLPLRAKPRPDAPLQTEALFGETLTLYENREGWAWGQLDRDGYVGYLPSEGLSADILRPTHRIAALRTYVYPAPDIKQPPLALLSLNARIAVDGEADGFLSLATGGFVFAGHTVPFETYAADFVAVAERFLGTPYLWGGRSSLGLDCSALVQLALEAAGLDAPRDTDMQAGVLGTELAAGPLRRGDLVFWPGHVGIMTSAHELLHANAFHMEVAAESFGEARARIAVSGTEVSCIRRPEALGLMSR